MNNKIDNKILLTEEIKLIHFNLNDTKNKNLSDNNKNYTYNIKNEISNKKFQLNNLKSFKQFDLKKF